MNPSSGRGPAKRGNRRDWFHGSGARRLGLNLQQIMKKIIHEIRNQPQHVRELATVLCTIAVVAVVVTVWFHSFQKNIYALLNPDQQPQAQDQMFAQESKSLFGSILQTISDGRAQISNLFSGKSQTDIINAPASQTNNPSNVPHPLPVSPNK